MTISGTSAENCYCRSSCNQTTFYINLIWMEITHWSMIALPYCCIQKGHTFWIRMSQLRTRLLTAGIYWRISISWTAFALSHSLRERMINQVSLSYVKYKGSCRAWDVRGFANATEPMILNQCYCGQCYWTTMAQPPRWSSLELGERKRKEHPTDKCLEKEKWILDASPSVDKAKPLATLTYFYLTFTFAPATHWLELFDRNQCKFGRRLSGPGEHSW